MTPWWWHSRESIYLCAAELIDPILLLLFVLEHMHGGHTFAQSSGPVRLGSVENLVQRRELNTLGTLMRKIFEYRHLFVGRLGWARNGPQLAEQIDQRAINAGGALFGLWAGQIGLWRDEGIMMTAWDDLQSARAHGPEMADASIHGLDRAIYLEATVRPTANEQPQAAGFYAHRWFEINSTDWPEFLQLSDEAWPSMEAAVNARILGFWREIGTTDSATLRVLLLTYYATLDDWERSRWWGRPNPDAHEAMRRFRRRTELVERTKVTISTLPAVPTG
jgi:hypothetical protein